jgi:uncharacterized membrane protein HdeD (DUF308 family)
MSANGALETQSGVEQTGLFPWWLVLIEGVAAVIIGVLLFLAPQATLELVLQLFGLFWLVAGVLSLVGAFTDPIDRGLKIAIGAAGVLAGIAVVRHPVWLAAALTLMVAGLLGCAGVTIGILSLLQAFRGGGWGAAIVGVLSVVFGLLVLFNPILTGAAWVFLYASVSLIGGLIAIVMAFKIRKPAGAAVAEVSSAAASHAVDTEPM